MWRILERPGLWKIQIGAGCPEDSISASFPMLRKVLLWPLNSHLTEKYLETNGIPVKIVQLSGSTEIAPFIGVSDLISDLNQHGHHFEDESSEDSGNHLKSSVHLIANPESYQEKKDKIEQIRTGIRGVLDAEGKKLVMMNVDEEVLDEV
jgi:ATP phosphoribosyltransferase